METWEGKNVFLLYRGTNQSDDNNPDQKYTNSKYIAARIYYELSEHDECNVFFAPACYNLGDNYQDKLDRIFSTVKVAIIITSKGMLDRCEENDTLFQELQRVFSSDIPIYIVQDTDGYSLLSDSKLPKLFPQQFSQDKISSNISKLTTTVHVYQDNNPEFFNTLFNAIYGVILSNYYSINDTPSSFIIKELSSCSSTTIIRDKIIEYIKHIIDQDVKDNLRDLIISLRDENNEISIPKLKNKVELWIKKVGEIVKHFSSLQALYEEEFLLPDNRTISIKKALEINDNDEALDEIAKIEDAIDKRHKNYEAFGKQYIFQNDSILTYSHSDYVANFLSGCHRTMRDTCNLYICETRSKSLEPFYDARNIFADVSNSIAGDRYFITDSSVYQLMSEGKITKVVLGACGITTRDGVLTQIINTSGSETIVRLAGGFNIPVYIISDSKKNIVNFTERDQHILTDELKRKIGDPERYLDCTYKTDEVSYIKIDRTDNMLFISEKGLDIEPVLKYFIDDIWKDGRGLRTENGIIVKVCDKNAYSVEKNFFSVLNGYSEICVPELLKFDDEKLELHLEKIKGIRVFELFVALDELVSEGQENAIKVKNLILDKCYEQQKIIWEIIKKNFDVSCFTAYPKSKIKDLLFVLLQCIHIYFPNINVVTNKDSLSTETEELYSGFERLATVVFRDSTVKNMILQCEELSGLDHIDTEESLVKLKSKLASILDGKNISLFEKAKVYDLDFASCVNLTTEYDDFIGLNMHERTYSVKLEKAILKNKINASAEDLHNFYLALLVRYLRFGGRKLLYKLINPAYHSIRFKYDNEQFYFKKLMFYMQNLYPEFKEKYPGITEIIGIFATQKIPSPKFNMFNEYIKASKNKVVIAPPWLGTWTNISD